MFGHGEREREREREGRFISFHIMVYELNLISYIFHASHLYKLME